MIFLKPIEKFKDRKNKDMFMKDELLQDALIRNLEIIGEAVKNLPNQS